MSGYYLDRFPEQWSYKHSGPDIGPLGASPSARVLLSCEFLTFQLWGAMCKMFSNRLRFVDEILKKMVF